MDFDFLNSPNTSHRPTDKTSLVGAFVQFKNRKTAELQNRKTFLLNKFPL